MNCPLFGKTLPGSFVEEKRTVTAEKVPLPEYLGVSDLPMVYSHKGIVTLPPEARGELIISGPLHSTAPIIAPLYTSPAPSIYAYIPFNSGRIPVMVSTPLPPLLLLLLLLLLLSSPPPLLQAANENPIIATRAIIPKSLVKFFMRTPCCDTCPLTG